MTDFTRLQAVLRENFKDQLLESRVRRGNELHCQVGRGAVPRLAEILRAGIKA
jgi:hypothetical protein